MNKFESLEVVLENYDEKMEDEYRIKEQNELIALFLKDPDASNTWFYEGINRVCDRNISKNELFIMRRYLWLNCKYFTNMFIHDVNTLTHYLFTFYNENVAYYEKINKKMKSLKEITGTKNIYRDYDTKVYRAVLCSFFSKNVFTDLKNRDVIKKCSGSYARFLLEDLTELLANHLGIEIDPKERNDDDGVIDIRLNNDNLPHKNCDDYIARLEFKLENIKSGYTQIKQLYDKQSKSLEEYKATLEEEAAINFFKSFNDPKNGRMLDQIAFTEQLIRKLQKNGTEFQLEIRSLPILIKQLNEFIKSLGIAPIKGLNETYRVTADDLEFIRYDGEPFYNEQEEKEVIVISSGWTYNGRIISSPMVRELK